MASELGIGIIGCGETAMQTCQGIAAAPNARVAMLMDARPEMLSALAEVFSAPTTTRVEDVLASSEVDAVYIAMPPERRAAVGIEAAAAGKGVLMEAPIAAALAEADALIAACREHGVALGLADPAVVDGGMAAARDLVRGGALGEITAVRITVDADTDAGGGILMAAAHALGVVRWATGLEAARVYAESGAAGGAGVVLRYANDAIGVVQAGSAVPGGMHEDRPGPRVYGTKGQLILAVGEPLVWLAEPLEGGRRGAWQPVRHSGTRGDRAEVVRRFAAAALAGEEPPSNGPDGRKVLEIVLAAQRSSERHAPVNLPLQA